MNKKIYCLGDCHGDYDKVCDLLIKYKLINEDLDWIAINCVLVQIGDLTDRGTKGIECIKLFIKLQKQALLLNSEIVVLVGNHDALILAQAFIHRNEYYNPDCTYLFNYNGGDIRESNIIAQDKEIFNWMKNRPVIYKIGNLLFQHADTMVYYFSLGKTIKDINKTAHEMLKTGEGSWNIFYEMCDCREWDSYRFRTHTEQSEAINHYMNNFNVDVIVHGHTRFVDNNPKIYHDGKIINVDGSLSNGYREDSDRGFIVSFSEISNFFIFDKK